MNVEGFSRVRVNTLARAEKMAEVHLAATVEYLRSASYGDVNALLERVRGNAGTCRTDALALLGLAYVSVLVRSERKRGGEE